MITNNKQNLHQFFNQSPGTFTRDFLQSFRQSSSYKNNSTEFNSDIDDDDKEVARNFNKNNN